MSVLAQLYGEAKGIEKSLDTMNKSLKQMQAQDKKSNQQEQKFRQEILKFKRRERADAQRNQDHLAETMDKAIGKKAGQNMMGGGLLTALAAALGVAVAASLGGKGLLDGKDDKEETPSPAPATPPPSSGGTDKEETKPETDTTKLPTEGIKAAPMPGSGGLPKIKAPPKKAFTELNILSDVAEPVEETTSFDKTKELDVLKRIKDLYKKETEGVETKQSGGFTGMVPSLGQPTTGDHFYTSVAPGSYIMNRNLVDAMGYQSGGVPVALEAGEVALPPGSYDKGMMDYLNYSAFPRFQEGGVVQAEHAHTGSGYSVGKDSQGRPSVFSKEAAEALMKAIQASDGAVKTSDITSSKRSKEHNTRVGGVPNSNHLSGNAVDIHGSSKIWLKEHGPKYGWHNLNYSGHDGHFDFKGGGSSGAPERTGTKGPGTVKEKNEKTASTDGQEGGGSKSIVSQFSEFGEFGKAAGEVMSAILQSMPPGLRGIFGGEFGGGGGDGGSGGAGDTKKGQGGQELGATTVRGGATESAGKYKNLLNLIASKESGAAGYNAYNEGGHSGGHGVSGYGGHSAKGPIGKNLTDMTISQIMKHQKDLDPPIHAAGRYQIIGPTMRGLMSGAYGATGVNPDDIFSPEVQDKLAIALIKGRMKSGATAKNFGQEWIGLQNVNQEQLQQAINNAKQKGGAVKYMKGGSVLAENLQELNERFKMQQMSNMDPIVIYDDEQPGNVMATRSGGADNNDPFFLPTRSTSWASAIMEYRERTFNQGF